MRPLGASAVRSALLRSACERPAGRWADRDLANGRVGACARIRCGGAVSEQEQNRSGQRVGAVELVKRLRRAACVRQASADNGGYYCGVTIDEAEEAAELIERYTRLTADGVRVGFGDRVYPREPVELEPGTDLSEDNLKIELCGRDRLTGDCLMDGEDFDISLNYSSVEAAQESLSQSPASAGEGEDGGAA